MPTVVLIETTGYHGHEISQPTTFTEMPSSAVPAIAPMKAPVPVARLKATARTKRPRRVPVKSDVNESARTKRFFPTVAA